MEDKLKTSNFVVSESNVAIVINANYFCWSQMQAHGAQIRDEWKRTTDLCRYPLSSPSSKSPTHGPVVTAHHSFKMPGTVELTLQGGDRYHQQAAFVLCNLAQINQPDSAGPASSALTSYKCGSSKSLLAEWRGSDSASISILINRDPQIDCSSSPMGRRQI